MSDALRKVRAQLRGARQLTKAAASDKRVRRELLRGLFGRSRRAHRAAGPGGEPGAARSSGADGADGYQPPAGLAEWAAHTHAEQVVSASVADTLAFVSDPGRFPEWLTTHTGWRGEAPQGAREGETFVQQARVMGIPVDVTWTVVSVGDSGLELHGLGPMGVKFAFWITVTEHPDGAKVFFDAGLDGQPIKGPMGASVLRSLTDELEASLAQLAGVLANEDSPGRARRAPVKHQATGELLDPNTPVLVGVGQVVQREGGTKDPAALSVVALRRAAEDAGAGEDLLRSADAVYAVASASWTYNDQAAAVAEGVGAKPKSTVQSTPLGGDGAQLLINDAAQAIADGAASVVLLSGAEAGATLAATDGTPEWPVQDASVRPTRVVGIDRPGNHEAETAVGLGMPIYMYALLETAVRAQSGRDPKEHRDAVGRMWSRFSAVAAKNPYAWQPQEFSAEEIVTPSKDNRMVSAPYTKLMCANLQVDLATGLIMCSAAAAEAAGIPQKKWVFVHAGASGHDEWFVANRAWLAASPAINALGRAVMEHAEVTADQLKHVDLYSCFPSAVQIAAKELGLPTDDPDRPLTVTGGLTFGGGPGNNYGSHGVASLVPLLRAEPEAYGLATSLGWYLTKHALGVYSAKPPKRPFRHLQPVIEHPPARPVRTDYHGPAVVEAYTVPYSREGEPEAAILSVLAPDGARALLRTTQAEVIETLLDTDAVGRPVDIAEDGTVTLGEGSVELPEPPPPPVLTERRGPTMIITLNRPEVRNAIDVATAAALERAIDVFKADPHARVAILTGAGGSFCAGMDLKAAARGQFPVTEKRGPLGLTAVPPKKPLIAAVEGHALAGGCELALAADLIVAAEDAQFGLPEPKRGLAAAAGGVMRLRERLPRNIAMEMALTGDPMPAQRLAELGLINALAPAGSVLDAALKLAERIAGNAPISVEVSKRIVDESSDWSTTEAFAKQADIAAAALASEDATEGVRAFAEKRDPVFKGR
ncbi:type II toxin-antitoxin system Rv0910 family toxin [Thermocrispum agreste]|uniref:type II toxin-antitoxin system Rv0910 family toxin n=1 Tax=Thermocrispum agreste TaxID=37925 RepID=UPI000401D3C9